MTTRPQRAVTPDPSAQTIEIRPASSVYATYQRLSYKPYYALAEFVDNSTASYFNHKKELLDVYRNQGPNNRCRIEIAYDQAAGRLVITDNAYGMEIEEFRRAITLDQPPPNRSGRNEFGMGLKTAACWFGTRWTVSTTQLGSGHHYTATIDVSELARTRRETITYKTKPAPRLSHGTAIIIEDVQQPIVGRAHERVREQLRSIYRNDLRTGEIEIFYQGEKLVYEEPELLTEETPKGLKVWREGVTFAVPWERKGKNLTVTGWVGIRKTMSRRDSGFVLMRRGRVIVGGPDQGYRPPEVCGSPQTHEYGRLVGELHLDNWPVNQAKDGFSWNDGLEDAFVEALTEACKDVTRKARTHRLQLDRSHMPSVTDMKAAAEPIREVVQTPPFRSFAEEELRPAPESAIQYVTEPTKDPPQGGIPEVSQPAKQETEEPIDFLLPVGNEKWLLRLHWQESQADQYWMSLQPPREARDSEPAGSKVVDISLNVAHPFLSPYLQNRASLDILQRLVFGLALSETIVRSKANGARVDPGAIRTKMNEVLRYASIAERQ